MFRLIVQDSRRSPSRGKIIVQLGHYDPHRKTLVVEKEKAAFFLEHGAHPSDRVAKLFKTEGIALPKWVHLEKNKPRPVKNSAKLRRNRPVETEKTVIKPKSPTTSETDVAKKPPVPEETITTEKTTNSPIDNSIDLGTDADTEIVDNK
jgi:small subunit ribosomal protein S16